MIKFIIDKLHLRNVRNYGDEGMDMDFPVGNLTVFTGHVGAGKSTILKSVSMALYGDDGGVKGEKLSIDDMVNERNGKNLEIELYFRAIDTLNNNHEDKYEIHLYHKHSKYQNKLVFIKNGIDISANGKMDTYRLIEKTIIPKDVYHNIYYFTQQAKNFFTALPNSEQKAIFDSILDLSDYDKYYQNCRDNITKYENSIGQSELQLNLLKSSVEEKDRLIVKEKENIQNLINNNKLELESLTNDIQKLNTELNKLKDENSLELNVSEIDKQLIELQSKIGNITDSSSHEIEMLNQKVNAIKTSIQQEFSDAKLKAKEKLEPIVKALQDKIHDSEKNKLVLDKDFNDKVSKLKQNSIIKCNDIKEKYSQKMDNLKDEVNTLLNDIRTKKSDADKEISDIKIKANDIKSNRDNELNKLQSLIDKENNSILQFNNRISEINRSIESNNKEINSDHPHCEKCGQELVNTDHLKRENKTLEEELDNIKIDKSKCDNNIKEYQSKCETIKTTSESDLNELRVKAKKIVEDFTNYKSENDKQVIAKNSEIKGINDNIESETKQIQYQTNNEVSTLELEYNNKTNELDQNIASINQDIESETYKAKQELINLSKVLTTKQNESIKKIQDDIVTKQKDCNSQINNINDEINDLRLKKLNQLTVENRISELEDDIHQKEMQKNLKNDFSPSQDGLKSLIESKQHDEDALKVQVKHHDDLVETLKVLEFWKTAFSDSGIKSMLIDVAIPHMNRCVREELDRVCPGTFTVSFDTLSQTKSGTIRDKFAINIIHNLKCATGHKKLSGGEKRIIDFCCMSALRSLAENLYGKMFCHIFYDEVLDSLDSESRELFCRSMKTQSSDERHVLLVTHALTEDVEPDRVFPF